MPPVFKVFDAGTALSTANTLERGAVAAVELEEPFAEIILDMFRVEKAVFSSQGRRGGGSWKQLTPEYARRKGNTKILQNTGALYDSLTQADAPYQILNIEPASITFGTRRPAAGVHQKGAPSKGIPARPFMKFTLADATRWNRIIARHIMKGFVK